MSNAKPHLILTYLLAILVLLACNLPLSAIQQNSPPIQPTATRTDPTATPTLTPSPTPSPALRIHQAEEWLRLGQNGKAREGFQQAALNTTDVELQAVAMLGIGRSYFQEGNYNEAIASFRALIEEHPPTSEIPEAWYWLGRSYSASAQPSLAAEAYARFIEMRPGILDDIIQTLRGDALMAAGRYTDAIQAYQAAIQASSSDTTALQIKIGQAYAAANDFTNAITQYLQVYNASSNEYVKAQMNLLIGQIYLQLGYPEQAYTRFLDSVNHFPRAYDSYSGLVALVNAGIPVDEFQRGLVDYYAGQYSYAIEAFGRYIKQNPNHDARPHFYRALSWRALGNIQAAASELQELINTHPNDTLWPNAWRELAYTQWAYLEDYEAAANTLKEYLRRVPDAPDAVEIVFETARILERGGRLSEAAALWEGMINNYPTSDLSLNALFLAGITYYRAQKVEQALTALQRYLVLGDSPENRAAAWLWIGKCHWALQDPAQAQKAWQEASTQDPLGYYGIRAAQLLSNTPPLTAPANYDLGYDLSLERPQAEAWLRQKLAIPADVDLNTLGELANDPLLQRGDLLWRLGLYTEARNTLETLRKSLENDPVNLYRLMNHALDLGAYRIAIFAARRLVDLSGLAESQTLEAPAYFNHIRFGLYYRDVIVEAAARENIHPLLLFSIIRQESFFEDYVQSSAGAVGLMQLMPSTAADLAKRLNWPPNYQEADLLNPQVNVFLGARYLAMQRDYFGGDLYAALAAYNAGPGNAKIWHDLASGDPDLFVEIIRYPETRNYITQIATFLEYYVRVYQRRP